MFALQALNPEEAQETFSVEADSSEDSFCLSRPDLCLDNIIVDDELHIRGVIDWEEFSATVPRDGVYPASVASRIDRSSEFMNVMSSRKQLSPNQPLLA
ncbi:hypothetical protein E5D57_011810 [Metarhizium anisopliae]|nr:hypothetical protein E5D57_011810 [Metarhizium anisopliae]